MPKQDKPESSGGETTSEESSKTTQMTPSSRAELHKRLLKRSQELAKVAYMLDPERYAIRGERREQKKKIRDLLFNTLKNLPISEQVLLLEELRSRDEPTKPSLILPDGAESSKLWTPH